MADSQIRRWKWLDESNNKLYPVNEALMMCAPICGNGNNLDAAFGYSVKLMCPMCQAVEGFIW